MIFDLTSYFSFQKSGYMVCTVAVGRFRLPFDVAAVAASALPEEKSHGRKMEESLPSLEVHLHVLARSTQV